MATSAIGPGFLTQTTVFTEQLLASFGFVILLSILLDIGVQLNIWRIITAANKPAQEIANAVIPGMGSFLAALIIFGGLAFNIGNIAGAGLGLEVLTGMDNRIGAGLSALIAIALLIGKNSNKAMDHFVKALGILMIALTVYVVFQSDPPVGEAVYRSFLPARTDWTAVITIVGGTVGGYICFAGAHRLLDAGVTGQASMKEVSGGAIRGILTASAMRILLFLAALGVVAKGIRLDAANPAADVFRQAAGNLGYRVFGLVMWSAAITSVIGSAYTSISFIRSERPFFRKYQPVLTGLFILVSTGIYLWVGKPVSLLIWAGTINGFILPVSLVILLAATFKPSIMNHYQHPKWLTISGLIIALLMAAMAIRVLFNQ